MSNPLVDMRTLVSGKPQKTLIGEVVGKKPGKVSVKLRAGNEIVVWGNETVGSEVLVRGNTVVAVISKEDVPTVYIP